MESHQGIEIDALLDEDVLCYNAGDEEGVTEKTLMVTRSLISAVVYEGPVSNKVEVELL